MESGYASLVSLRRFARLLAFLLPYVLIIPACGLTDSESIDSAAEQRPASSSVSVSPSTSSSTSSSATSSSSTTTSTTAAPITTMLPEPGAETDLAVLADFVNEHNGDHEVVDAELAVTELEPDEGKENIPPEAFVDRAQWTLFRILGLVDPEADALAVGQHRINTIRGTCCPIRMWENNDHPLLRSSVLVHELTHLADDSRGFNEELSDRDNAIGEREPVPLFAVPIEGNASRVQRLYETELLAAGAKPERFLPGWDSPAIPEVMVRVWAFAYTEGQAFMQALADRGGTDLVEMAFDRPPISSEQVYDIDAYLDQEYPLEVTAPQPPSGAETLQSPMTLGAFVLGFLAEQTLSPEVSRALVTAWAGDSAVLYATGDRWCAEATIVMDGPSAASDLIAVLEAADIEATGTPGALDTVHMIRCIETPGQAG